jgi:hypothetical protein
MAMQRQKQFAWGATAFAIVMIIPVAWVMLGPIFGLRDEPGTARHAERCLADSTAPACQEVTP